MISASKTLTCPVSNANVVVNFVEIEPLLHKQVYMKALEWTGPIGEKQVHIRCEK